MKNIILAILLLTNAVANAQKGAHHISLGISNNGQLSKAMNDYYFSWFYNINVPNYKQLEYKTDLTYSYSTAKQLEFGISVGYAQRTENYSTNTDKVNISQHYLSGMPFIMKGWNFNSIQVSAGAGIPYYFISDHDVDVTSNIGYSARMHITGGNAIGLNGLVRLKWNFTERLSVNGMAGFGLLYMDYGRENILYNYDTDGNLTGKAFSLQRQRRTTVPAPELSLSIGFKI